ncbi:MAG: hypothetical protein NC111_06975 [Bacteroides sp.]|nr:hypothetical protein [Bacteroides sp.]MCM1413732.1 hypothetical protein [Bacteroides sp.]MCM1472249.1 hypothetical protein [Bacteroides sp.]
MVRRSDEALMLIDLDKAYCDTLDKTHGGTPGVSDAVSAGQRPVAAKDYAAIGKVFESIFKCNDKPIPRKYRKFRQLCDDPNVTSDKLIAALESRYGYSKIMLLAIIIIVNIMIICALLYLFMSRTKANNESEANASAVVEEMVQDTIHDEPTLTIEENKTSSSFPQPPKSDAIENDLTEQHEEITDFDQRMEEYIKEVGSALNALRSGRLTESEIQDIATHLSQTYKSSWEQIKNDFRKNNTEASESEVTMAMATALGESKTFKLMNDFNKELIDTINRRVGRE